jgi:hypothetical protein
MTPSTQTMTTTQIAFSPQSSGVTPAGASQPDAEAAAPGPADTPRISGELAARLLLSSRWQQ